MSRKRIIVEEVDGEAEDVNVETDGYVLIYWDNSKSAKVTGELDPKAFAPLLFNALAKKFGG